MSGDETPGVAAAAAVCVRLALPCQDFQQLAQPLDIRWHSPATCVLGFAPAEDARAVDAQLGGGFGVAPAHAFEPGQELERVHVARSAAHGR